MSSQFNITARLNVELGNVTRATSDLQRQFSALNVPVTVGAAGAVTGLQKVTSGAQAGAAALRQMQAQAASSAATLQATVTVTNAGAASLRNFGEQAGLAARRFVAFTAAAGSMVSVVRGIHEGVRAAVEFGLSMNKIEQVSDEVSSKMVALRTEIGSLSTSLGVSSAALAETAITLKQAGLSIDQTRDALKALAMTDLAPTFDSMKQSTEGLIAAFRQFNLTSGQFETTLGSMNAVAGKFAVESSDIISAVQRAGGAFKMTAGDMKSGSEALNEFMALFTSVRATTRESADSIATGLRTVFTRFQRGDTVKALSDLGINLRYTREEAQALGQTNLSDQFVGAYEAVRRLSQGLEGLRETDPRYAQVIEQLGGYRQISRVVPLLKEFKTAEEAKNIAVAGGISLQLAAEKRQEALANKISRLKEEYLELFRKVTESKSFEALSNTMLGVASSFAKVLDYARPLLPLLTTLAAVKLGTNLGNIGGAFTRAFVAPPGAAVSGGRPGGFRFASGGPVPGMGSTDTVPAMLTPGEFVVKKRSAERIGYHRLHGLNERPERFADGGKVDSSAPTGEYAPAVPRGGAGKVFSPLPPTGPRKPLGPRANDLRVQALEILTRGRPERPPVEAASVLGRVRRLFGYASGGYVPGSGNNDTEPALLMPGEFVLNKMAVAKLGVPALRELNEGRSRFCLKGYATGSTDPVGGERERLLALRDKAQAGATASRNILSEGPGLISALSGSGVAGAEDAVRQLREELVGAAAELGDFERILGDVNAKIVRLGTPAEPASPAQRAAAAVPVAVPSKVEPAALLAPAPSPAEPGRGQALLARLRAKQAPAPKLTDDLQALSFWGGRDENVADPREKDVPFVSVAADVYRDSEDKAEIAREKAARAFFEQQNAPEQPATPSFVARLKDASDEQKAFFAKYTVGTPIFKPGYDRKKKQRTADEFVGTTPSLAESVADHQARMAGNIGRAGIASGVVEDAAHEAVARLAVAPPDGFDPKRADAEGFVVRYIQNAVRSRLSQEYGSRGKRFGGYAPRDTEGNLVEFEGREPDPAAPVDYGAAFASTQAHEATRARQLEQVRAVLPASALSGERDDRFETLRKLGANYKDASFGAAEVRYTDVLAGHVGAKLGVTPPGATPPPSDGNFVGPAPGGGSGPTRPRDGTHTVPLNKVEAFVKSLGLGRADEVAVRSQILAAANQTNKAGHLTAGLSDAALEVKNGRFARVAGVVDNASVFNPQAAQVNKFVRDGERSLPPREPAPKRSALTAEEELYQATQLVEAQKRYGSTYGVAGDELASNRRLGRGQARGDIQAFEFEQRRRRQVGLSAPGAGRTTPADLLINQRAQGVTLSEQYGRVVEATRNEQLAASRREEQDADKRAKRQARDAQGLTDPLAIKQQAIRAFASGNGGFDVLDGVKGRLSSAQYLQVVGAAQRAGFGERPNRPVPPKSIDLVEFARDQRGNPLTNEDGRRTVVGGALSDRADRRARERIAARGGDRNLSDGTRDAIRQQAGIEEEARVRRELVSAQKNLLAKLQPEMSAHERSKKALEDVEKAMSGLARVARDQQGQLLGLSQTVDDARKKGVDAPGAGGFRYRASAAIGDRLAAAREFASNNKLTRLNGRLADYASGPLFGLAATGVGIGTSLVADRLDRDAGRADDAVRTASGTSGYRTNKGAAGALQGAALGAAVGAAGGPVGIAIGAVVGGAAGLYSALSDAANDIRQAKINNALTELGDKLSAFVTGIPDSGALAGVRANLETYQKGARERARDEATSSLLYRGVSGDWDGDGIDDQKYVESLRASNRKELGPLLPQLTQGISKQAELLGRGSPGASADDLLGRLRDGSGKLNAEFIRIVAELRGVPVKQVEDEFRKVLVSAQQQKRVEDANRAGRAAAEQQANTFGRLLQSVQSAADSLYGLQQRAGALTDVLDGTVTAARVTAHVDRLDEGFGRPDRGALAPLSLVAGATGEAGRPLLRSGEGADAVASVLPGVLASVRGASGLEKANVGSRVQEGLLRGLGYKDVTSAPEAVQRAILSVTRGVNETASNGEGEFNTAVGTDVTAYAEKLLGDITGPLRDTGGKIAKQLEDNGNRFVEGLTALHQRLQTVGQMYDQLANLKTSNFRQNLQTWAENNGRGNQALDLASVQQLEFGANQKQQRLAGVAGAAAFDPRLLGQQLAQVRAQIGAAVERQQAAFEKPDGVRGGAFQAAAENLLRLKDRAANLQQALKNLSDVAEQSAVLQEKLNRLKQEEDGRLSLGERFLSADPTEQLRMNRGFVMANQAARAGNLDGFGSEDRRLIIDTLRGAGGVTLSGFQGAPRADDLLRNLVSNSAGGAFQLTRGQKEERAALQGAQAGRQKTAEEAVAQLIAHQESGSAELFRNLQQQQAQFFSKLERLLLGMKKADVENAIARAQGDKAALDEKGGARALLAGVGVTTTAQLDALRGKGGDIEGLRAAIAAEKATKDAVAAAKGRVGQFGPGSGGMQMRDWLANSGLDAGQIGRVDGRHKALVDSGKYRKLRADAYAAGKGSPADMDAIARKALTEALVEEGAQDTAGPVRAAAGKLTGVAGVDAGAVQRVLSGPQADAFVKALTAFDAGGDKIEDFGAKVAAITAELARLDEQLKALNAGAAPRGGPAVPRAYGGDIFRPVGTDTVPAMLTPGEFVINARSAAANAALLHRINEARGPVAYLAGGGQAARKESLGDEIAREIREQREAGEAMLRRQEAAKDTAFGDRVAAAQMRNFNRQAGAFDGTRRPGDEGQRNIANRVAAVRERQLEEQWRNNESLKRYTAARVQRFATGGFVGGAGTGDTVPSLLTPGEFVLNTSAVARLGAHNVARFNQGGAVGNVNYLANGGQAQANTGSSGGPVSFSGEAAKAMTDLSSTLAQFVQQAGGFGQAAQSLAQTFNVFAGSAQALTQALSNMPKSLTIQGTHQVSVVINGAEVMSKLTPEIQQLVTTSVKEQLGRVFKEHMPDAWATMQV